MKILVTLPMGPRGDGGEDFITPEIVKTLESMGEVIWNTSTEQLSSTELKHKLKDVDVCVTGWGCPRFEKSVLEGAQKLQLIAHTGGSVAPIVSDCLYDRGIKIISGNELYAESVAEGTLAYILSSLRNIPHYTEDMKNGGWRTTGFYNEGILDQSIGLVGFGMVAKYLVKMLAPFRNKIKVYDPHVRTDILAGYGVESASLEEIFSTCKIISLHAPKIPETYHLVNKQLLEMIPDGTILVNTARGSVVDENALIEELYKNRFKAVLDVYEVEPLPLDSALRKLDNVILIPHMAGPTLDRRKHVTMALIDDIKRFLRGERLKYEISREYAITMTR